MPQRIIVRVQRFADRPTLQLQYTDPATGRRRTKSAGTADPVEAERLRADLEYELSHGLHAEPSRVGWDAFRDRFEDEYLPGVRPATAKLYRLALDQLEEACHPSKVADVDARCLSRYAAWLRKRPGLSAEAFAASTIANRLRYVRAVLRWAARQDFLPRCPEIPAVRVPRKRPQPVPEEAWERLLERAEDPQLKVLLLCCWLAGLRLNEGYELSRLPADDCPWLDLGRSRIIFPAAFVKANEDQWVPLDPALREALARLPQHPSGKVFHFTDLRSGGRPVRVRAGSVSQRVARLARKAGVRIDVRALRRGFACRYAAEVPAQVLQRLLRHSSIVTTLTYYANCDEAAEEAILGKKEDRERAASTETISGPAPPAPARESARPA